MQEIADDCYDVNVGNFSISAGPLNIRVFKAPAARDLIVYINSRIWQIENNIEKYFINPVSFPYIAVSLLLN